jgi:high-affinity iron transporter
VLATALIVFREVFEASLIVSIVLAASLGLPGRGRWVGLGVAAGVAGALVVAVSADAITDAVAGMGQELLNATILLAAVVMLGWHNVWMGRHARQMTTDLTSKGEAVLAGAKPVYALAVVVGLAVMREGSEVVLFLYGIAASSESSTSTMLLGGALGLAGGVAIGATLYFGLLRIPVRHLFTVTSWMILLLAAGMAAQGARFLIQADWLPALGQALWDSSGILTERSVLGQVLHTLVGYVARPSGMQLVFYAATLLVIGGLMRAFRRQDGAPLAAAGTSAAAAGHEALSPFAEKGVLDPASADRR